MLAAGGGGQAALPNALVGCMNVCCFNLLGSEKCYYPAQSFCIPFLFKKLKKILGAL